VAAKTHGSSPAAAPPKPPPSGVQSRSNGAAAAPQADGTRRGVPAERGAASSQQGRAGPAASREMPRTAVPSSHLPKPPSPVSAGRVTWSIEHDKGCVRGSGTSR